MRPYQNKIDNEKKHKGNKLIKQKLYQFLVSSLRLPTSKSYKEQIY